MNKRATYKHTETLLEDRGDHIAVNGKASTVLIDKTHFISFALQMVPTRIGLKEKPPQ